MSLYWISSLFGQVLAKEGFGALIAFLLVVCVLGATAWTARSLKGYLDGRLAIEEEYRRKHITALEQQNLRAATAFDNVAGTLSKCSEDDHRFQAKAIEALHGIQAACFRLEGGQADHGRESEELARQVIGLQEWLRGHHGA